MQRAFECNSNSSVDAMWIANGYKLEEDNTAYTVHRPQRIAVNPEKQ